MYAGKMRIYWNWFGIFILFNLEKDYITGKGRQKGRVMARDVACYWSVIELGESMIDVARRFDIMPSAIGYAVQRGEKIVKKGDLQLID